MIALVEAYKAGLLNQRFWLRNIISGAIVGVVALPLAMAFAIASGAKPEQGLYTAIVAGLCVSIFGGSRLQIAGPTGAFIVILAAITAQYGIEGLQIATIMAGLILLVLGIARLGIIIKFIPEPVIVGFTAGIAVIIWVGQWKDFFGLPSPQAEHFHQKLALLIQALPHFHAATTLLACLSLALLYGVPKITWAKKIPGPLVALVIGTLIQAIFQFDGVNTIGKAFGGIPQGLPVFTWHSLTIKKIVELIGPAFTIAMLGAIESLLSAVVADGMAGTKHNSNQELIGQGIANIITPFFGGFAATGAIARTATNIRNGGNSPLAGIIHAVMLILIILFLAPLAVYIPLAVLAAILFMVAWNMSEAKHFLHIIKKAPYFDVFILLVTFTLTIFIDLVVAVNIGVVLAMLNFVRHMANSVEVKETPASDIQHELQKEGLTNLPDGMMVYTVQGPFFFGAVENFERALAATNTDPRVLILYLRWVPFIDFTGIQTLAELITNFQQRGVSVLLVGANVDIRQKLAKAGLEKILDTSNIFSDFAPALKHAALMLTPSLANDAPNRYSETLT